MHHIASVLILFGSISIAAAQLYNLFEGNSCLLHDGSSGTCKNLNNCMWIVDNLRQRRMSQADIRTCSFMGAIQIVCCGDERPQSVRKPSTTLQTNGEDSIVFDSAHRGPKRMNFTTTSTRQPIVTTHSTTTERLLIRGTTSRPTTQIQTKPISTTTSTTTTPRATTAHSFWTQWSPTKETTTKPEWEKDMLSLFDIPDDDRKSSTQRNQTHSNLVQGPVGSVGNINQSNKTTNALDLNEGAGDGSNHGGSDANDLNIGRNLPNSRRNKPSAGDVNEDDVSSRHPRVRKTDLACQNYSRTTPPLSFNILNGIPTVLGEFPHMAGLGYRNDDTNDIDFDCGGSLISDSWVLSAAHCITTRRRPTLIRLGKVTLHTDDDDVEAVDRNVADIIRHPEYNARTKVNDIALIRMESPVQFDDNVKPACLRTDISDVPPDAQLFITGWGSVEATRSRRSGILLKTNLTSLMLPSCNSTLMEYNQRANQPSLRNGLMRGQLCAYDPEARSDACQGDSGGPIQLTNERTGISTVVGVVSFGISCGTELPSVYTRVAHYLDWIEPIVWPN